MNRYRVAGFLIATALFSALIIVQITKVNAGTQKHSADPVYVICDVYDVIYNGSTVEIDIILPNKDLLTRQMSIESDLPEDFSEVVIEAIDLDDYSTYKIVGMR